jgi:probable HAF family extracellular repeat protein
MDVVAGSGLKIDTFQAFIYKNKKIIRIGGLGGDTTSVSMIDSKDRVIGASLTKSEAYHAYLYENGKMSDLGTLGGTESRASCINKQGFIVGSSETAKGDFHAFIYMNGAMTDLGSLGSAESRAIYIDDNNVIYGVYGDVNGKKRLFKGMNGKLADIGIVSEKRYHIFECNNKGTVTGAEENEYGPRAFIYKNGQLSFIRIGNRYVTQICGINNNDQAVGYDRWAQTPYLYCDGKVSLLNEMLDKDSRKWKILRAKAINDKGSIVCHAVLKGSYENHLVLLKRK